MKEMSRKDRLFPTIKDKTITIFRSNSSILDDCVLINIKRIYYLSLIIIPMCILNVYIFASATPAPATWGRGIFLSNLALSIFYVGVFLITCRLKNAKVPNITAHILQYIIPIITLTFGIVIVTIDQLVTTNITPFLIVSIGFGALLLIRPLASALIYIASYLVYYYSIALILTDQQMLLSNRVNGATIIALGFLISVINWYYNYTNITQKQHIEMQQKQLEQMAYYDSLTNLYNRHFFNKVVEKELFSIQRYGHRSVIIILDIDNFKNINDTYGHLIGDQVLKQLAQLIVNNVRKSDTVSRFGGEEFIILASRISLEEGFELAEKLRNLVAEKAFTIDSTTLYITASFGVSLLQATEEHGFEKYFSLADEALYLAKKRGKNRVEKISYGKTIAAQGR
jgi:diguanylate cyclase (GGDEF)-like protein